MRGGHPDFGIDTPLLSHSTRRDAGGSQAFFEPARRRQGLDPRATYRCPSEPYGCRPSGSWSRFNKSGALDPAQEAAEIVVEFHYPRKRVCDVLGAPALDDLRARRCRAAP